MVIQPLRTFPVALAGLVLELSGVKIHPVGEIGNTPANKRPITVKGNAASELIKKKTTHQELNTSPCKMLHKIIVKILTICQIQGYACQLS